MEVRLGGKMGSTDAGGTAVYENGVATSPQTLEQLLFEGVPLALLQVSGERRVLRMNRAACEAVGCTEREALGRLGGEVFNCVHAHGELGCGRGKACETCIVRQSVERTLATGEDTFRRPATLALQGSEGPFDFHLLVTTIPLSTVNGKEVLLAVEDITELKTVEAGLRRAHQCQETALQERTAELRRANELLKEEIDERRAAEEEVKEAVGRIDHLNRVLRAIRNVNQLIVHERDPQRLLDQACRLLVETRGYNAAWIVTSGQGDKPQVWAQAGWGEGFGEMGARLARGEWPACRALAQASTEGLAVLECHTTCQGCPLWSDRHHDRALVGELRVDGRQLGLVEVSFPKNVSFTREEQSLLKEVAGDIAFALWANETESSLKTEQALLREIAANFPNSYLSIIERDLTVSFSSGQEFKKRQLDPRSFNGKSIDQIFGEHAPFIREKYLETFDGKEMSFELAFNGEHRSYRTVPLPNERGEVERILAVVENVTERKQTQARLAQADRLSSMGLLAAGVAHEINNPLTFVLYNLESLIEDLNGLRCNVGRLLDQVEAKFGSVARQELAAEVEPTSFNSALAQMAARFDEALRGSRRIRDIARGLGTFSRVEEEQLGPVSLPHVIEVAAKMVQNEVRYRARFRKDLRPVPTVIASEGRLSQVFLNLLINATHAIEEGDIEHNEILVRSWAERNEVFAEVRDTGEGILPEHLDQLFDPFFTTKKVGLGSGLGLAISKNIIESYGGTITVASDAGLGASFTIRLPASTPGHESVPERFSPVPTPVRGRVLVIDDEAGVRQVVARMLRKHEVVEAESGAAAREIIERDQQFDVVLCDVMMMDVSGIDLHKWLSGAYPRLARKLVFITGGAFTPRTSAYLNQVDNTRVAKPFSAHDLRRLVEELVLASQGERE